MASSEEDTIEIDTAQCGQDAMSNADILYSIFLLLSREDWKSCRKVCKVWNEVATPLFGKKSYLCLNKFCAGMLKYDLMAAPPVIHQLIRNMKVTCAPTPAYRDHRGEGKYSKLMDLHFFTASEIYKDRLEEILVTGDLNFYRILGLVFGKLNFSRLRKLGVHESNVWTGELSLESYSPKIKRLVGMEMLEFTASQRRRQGWTADYGYLCHPTYQELLNACPNLSRLKIEDNFYPDLSKCSKLKSLEWSGFPFADLFNGSTNMVVRNDFSHKKLYNVLNTVAGSIEVVRLGATYQLPKYWWNPPNYPASLWVSASDSITSCFPKLTSLTIDSLRVYYSLVATVNQKRFPALQTLKLIGRDEDWFSWFDDWRREQVCLPNLVSLSISKPLIANVLGFFPGITKMFPNLEEFSIGLYQRMRRTPRNRPTIEENFKEILNGIASSFVNLDRLTIQIHISIDLSHLMEALCRPKDSKDLASLTVVLESPKLVKDNGGNGFEKAFVHYKNITLDGFLLKGQTSIRMNDFARLHNIQLNFIN